MQVLLEIKSMVNIRTTFHLQSALMGPSEPFRGGRECFCRNASSTYKTLCSLLLVRIPTMIETPIRTSLPPGSLPGYPSIGFVFSTLDTIGAQ